MSDRTELLAPPEMLHIGGVFHFEQWRDRVYEDVPWWKEVLASAMDKINGWAWSAGRVTTVLLGPPIARLTYRLRHRKILQTGWLVDQWDAHNIVTREGLGYALGVALDGSTAQITAWYLGLKDETSDPLDGTETYASPAFTELTSYDEATRAAWTAGAISGTTTKSIDNSAAAATFTISGTDSYVGVALFGGGTAATTKGNSAGGGTLFSAANFTSAKALVDNDTLEITYTFTATNA